MRTTYFSVDNLKAHEKAWFPVQKDAKQNLFKSKAQGKSTPLITKNRPCVKTAFSDEKRFSLDGPDD